MKKIIFSCFSMLFLGNLNSFAYENTLSEDKSKINVSSGGITDLNLMTVADFYSENLMQEKDLLGIREAILIAQTSSNEVNVESTDSSLDFRGRQNEPLSGKSIIESASFVANWYLNFAEKSF